MHKLITSGHRPNYSIYTPISKTKIWYDNNFKIVELEMSITSYFICSFRFFKIIANVLYCVLCAGLLLSCCQYTKNLWCNVILSSVGLGGTEGQVLYKNRQAGQLMCVFWNSYLHNTLSCLMIIFSNQWKEDSYLI